MFKDGLIYQESRMSTEEEFREDLAPLDIYDENADGQGGPVLAYEDGIAYTDPGEGHSVKESKLSQNRGLDTKTRLT